MIMQVINWLIDTGFIFIVILMIPFALKDLLKKIYPERPFEQPYILTYEESRWASSRAMEMKAEGTIPSDVAVTAFWSETDNRIVLQDVANRDNVYYP